MAEIQKTASENGKEQLLQAETANTREELGKIAKQVDGNGEKSLATRARELFVDSWNSLAEWFKIGKSSSAERASLRKEIEQDNPGLKAEMKTVIEPSDENIGVAVIDTKKNDPEKAKESGSVNEQVQAWMDQYDTVTREGLDTILCEPVLSNAFFWKTETTEESLAQDPIFEIRDEKVYFLNGNVSGQRVFSIEQFESVLSGQDCCPGIDHEQIEQDSTEIEYDRCCKIAKDTCDKYPDNVVQTDDCAPDEVVIVTKDDDIEHSNVKVCNGEFRGDYVCGCLQGSFQLTPDEFGVYVEGVCDTEPTEEPVEEPVEEPTSQTGIPLSRQLGAEDFCPECDEFGETVLDVDYAEYVDIVKDRQLKSLEDISDEELEDLDQKIQDLKGQKQAHMRRFTGLERALLFVPTGAYILLAPGRALRKVRREKARREQLGLNKDQYKRLKKLQKIDKKAGRANYNELKPVSPDQEHALNDKDDFKRYKDEYKRDAEAEKADFIAETSKGAFRQKRRQNRRNSRAEETKINKESKRDLKEAKARKKKEDPGE